MENDKNAKNFAGLNIGGIVGDQGTVTINKLEVVQGNKITILRTDNSRTEISISDPFYGVFEESSAKGKSPEVITRVDEIRTEANKGDSANPGFIQQRLVNLAKMAPDIFEVVVATLINPVNGFALAVQKIAQKAKEEYK